MIRTHASGPSRPFAIVQLSSLCCGIIIVATLAVPAAAQRIVRQHEWSPGSTSFGNWLLATGDMDGDGIGDYAYSGVPNLGQPSMITHLISGAVGTLIRAVAVDSITGAGDLNGDGRSDVLRHSGFGAGGALVYSVEDAVTGAVLQTYIVQPSSGLGFIGRNETRPVDLDGDGAGELLYRTQGYNFTQEVGVRTGVGAQVATFGTQAFHGAAELQTHVTQDFDGDGWRDLFISGVDMGFVVRLYSSRTGTVLRSYPALATIGGSVAFCPVADLNGDGFEDLIIYGIGALSGSNGTLIWGTIPSPLASIDGSRIKSMGDIDGDGKPELAFTSFLPSNLAIGSGQRVLGFLTGATGSFHFGFVGESSNFAVDIFDVVGDLTGDGLPEIVTRDSDLFYPQNAAPKRVVVLDPRGLSSGNYTVNTILGTRRPNQALFVRTAPPALGNTALYNIVGAAPNAPAIIFVDTAPPVPSFYDGDLLVWLNFANAPNWQVVPIPLNVGGSFAISHAIPSDPILLGLHLTLQVGFVGPSGLDVSTASFGTIGY